MDREGGIEIRAADSGPDRGRLDGQRPAQSPGSEVREAIDRAFWIATQFAAGTQMSMPRGAGSPQPLNVVPSWVPMAVQVASPSASASQPIPQLSP